MSPIPFCTVVQENIAGGLYNTHTHTHTHTIVLSLSHTDVLRIYAAILRNLSCENAAFRKEIVAFNGIETLLKVYISIIKLRVNFRFVFSCVRVVMLKWRDKRMQRC